MNELRPVNRPPAFNLATIEPSDPVVRINTQCRDQQEQFLAEIIELDVEQDLVALWFWNYDPGANYPEDIILLGGGEQTVGKTGDIRRNLRPYGLPLGQPNSDLDAEGANTLEVFVVESSALDRGAEGKPFFRKLRDCKSEGYPGDCISTHPAVMRWTIENYSGGVCGEMP